MFVFRSENKLAVRSRSSKLSLELQVPLCRYRTCCIILRFSEINAVIASMFATNNVTVKGMWMQDFSFQPVTAKVCAARVGIRITMPQTLQRDTSQRCSIILNTYWSSKLFCMQKSFVNKEIRMDENGFIKF